MTSYTCSGADAPSVDDYLYQARRLRAQTLANGFRAVLRTWRLMRDRRRTQAALDRCSDQLLNDIGISRQDIPMVIGKLRTDRPFLLLPFADGGPRIDQGPIGRGWTVIDGRVASDATLREPAAQRSLTAAA